jgi:hypothetical protein
MVGVVVVAAGGLGWGRPGLVAAALGTVLSLGNVWALHRFAVRAVAAVPALGPAAASAQLTGALAAKTMVLLLCLWLLGRAGGLAMVPLGLGLLVSVFALLGAGLGESLRKE